MGRAHLVGNTIVELNRRIQQCEKNKEKLLSYVQSIKDKCLNREITYSEYEDLLNKKRKGKTIQGWLDHYDSYIKQCRELIKHEKRKTFSRNALLISFSLAFISLLVISGFYLRPTIIGLIVKVSTEAYTQDLNLKLNESTDYEWKLEHLGQLQSVKISGLVQGEGEVKVYLDNLLILDSSKLESQKTRLTGSLITGLVAEDSETDGEENVEESFVEEAAEEKSVEEEVEEISEPEQTAEEVPEEKSYSEEQEEAPQQEESPSQEEPLSSEEVEEE